MSFPPQPTTVAGLTVGPAATAAPFWWDWIPPTYQGLSMALGVVILVLTVRKLWLENRRLDRDNKRGGS